MSFNCPKQGVDKIKTISLDVEEIFDHIFKELTGKMMSLKMERIEEYQEIIPLEYYFLIRTQGAFVSIIRFEIEDAVYEKIASSIYKGKELNEQEKKLYVTEYLNIICGRVLSEFSNILGKRSKLSVPMRVKNNEVNEISGQIAKLSYRCLSGSLNIVVYYNLTDE